MPQCPKCKKDFAKGVKAAYKLGLLDGENRLKLTINLMARTNGNLFNELTRLDRWQPLDDSTIKLTPKLISGLVKFLKVSKNGGYYARKLERLRKKQFETLHALTEIKKH